MYDFAIERILSFCEGEYLFMCVNRRWRRIYLYLHKNIATRTGSVCTRSIIKYVASTPSLVDSFIQSYNYKIYSEAVCQLLDVALCIDRREGGKLVTKAFYLSSAANNIHLLIRIENRIDNRIRNTAYVCALYAGINNRRFDMVDYISKVFQIRNEECCNFFLHKALVERNAEIVVLLLKRKIGTPAYALSFLNSHPDRIVRGAVENYQREKLARRLVFQMLATIGLFTLFGVVIAPWKSGIYLR